GDAIELRHLETRHDALALDDVLARRPVDPGTQAVDHREIRDRVNVLDSRGIDQLNAGGLRHGALELDAAPPRGGAERVVQDQDAGAGDALPPIPGAHAGQRTVQQHGAGQFLATAVRTEQLDWAIIALPHRIRKQHHDPDRLREPADRELEQLGTGRNLSVTRELINQRRHPLPARIRVHRWFERDPEKRLAAEHPHADGQSRLTFGRLQRLDSPLRRLEQLLRKRLSMPVYVGDDLPQL